MADDADLTEERMEFDNSITVKNVCKEALKIKQGVQGICFFCDTEFKRVIEVTLEGDLYLACGKCRDTYKLESE